MTIYMRISKYNTKWYRILEVTLSKIKYTFVNVNTVLAIRFCYIKVLLTYIYSICIQNIYLVDKKKISQKENKILCVNVDTSTWNCFYWNFGIQCEVIGKNFNWKRFLLQKKFTFLKVSFHFTFWNVFQYRYFS